MTAAAMTMREILVAAAAGVAHHIGSKWKLCHTENLLEAGITRIHVYDETDEEPEIWALTPLEITHPAAIIAAVVLAYRIRMSPAAQEAVNDTFDDDQEAEPSTPEPEARRFDA